MPPPLSTRTAWDLAESPYAAAIRRRRKTSAEILDLTITNPTTCGFHYNPAKLLTPLSDPAVLRYQPEPFGLPAARAAVQKYYAHHHAAIPPECILLTASTSESYSYIFRLLCSPGENILVPRPGYPLFDYLAVLDDVELRSYDMHHMAGWAIDFKHLEAQIDPKTRAIILVSPNNPTGHYTQATEREQLIALCEKHDLALIVDEVFLDYLIPKDLAANSSRSFAAGPATAEPPVPIFILSGISKIAALPQMKLGWIALRGPMDWLSQAIEKMEVIADTFLSVNTPAQIALPHWIEHRSEIQAQILERIRQNLNELRAITKTQPLLELLPPEAGWNAVLKLPNVLKSCKNGQKTSNFAINMVEKHGVLLHPGTLYGFPDTGWLVVSTIVPTETFCKGIALLAEQIGEESS